MGMNTKDIKIGKYYKMEIWEDEPIYVKCIDEDDGWFVMETFERDEWLVESGVDCNITKEVSLQEWGEALMSYMRAIGMGDIVDKFVKEAEERQRSAE